ncbi:MAG: DUF5724 domain-containing protein [Capsulimonadales bacterium]|nr:DUF5724 domain-containing protein [Capsulimonadales bacterium]
MLSAEMAKARLDAAEMPVADRVKRLESELMALPESLRSIGFVLSGKNENGKTIVDWHRRSEMEARAAAALDALDLTQRETLFSAFAPKLGRALALYWNFRRDIYQGGYLRRAFRITDRPELSRAHRFDAVEAILRAVAPYPDRDILWFGAYTGYMSYFAQAFGPLFAAVIDGGGEEGNALFDLLLATGKGEHGEAAMGRHVTRALLMASRREGWEFVEKLLLAAQRQEGLRQQILEAIDEGHPEAFRRMLRLLAEHEMMRFSATIRAVGVWFALGWDAPTLKQANRALNLAHDFMFDPEAREKALAGSDDGETVYLALWAFGFEDAAVAVRRASELLNDGIAVRRAAAVHVLQHLGLPEARIALLPALDDPDLRIATLAIDALNLSNLYYMNIDRVADELKSSDLFERLERNLPRFPKEAKPLDSILFPWIAPVAQAKNLAVGLVGVRGDRPLSRLLPYLSQMDAAGRLAVANAYASDPNPINDQHRDVLFGFLADPSGMVRNKALEGLKRYPAGDPIIVAEYEKSLSRKAAGLRRSVIDLLLRQTDEGVLASADRLMASKQEPQRVAGLGLLEEMAKAKRATETVREKARSFAAHRSAPSKTESALLESLLDERNDKPTLENALGLLNTAALSRGTAPQPVADPPILKSPTVVAILKGIDQWVEENRERTFVAKFWNGDSREMLLADGEHSFPAVECDLTEEENRARLPWIGDVLAWWDARPATMRDPDGHELVRTHTMLAILNVNSGHNLPSMLREYWKEFVDDLSDLKLTRRNIVNRLIDWLLRFSGTKETTPDFLLAAAETTLARVVIREEETLAFRESLGPAESPSVDASGETVSDAAMPVPDDEQDVQIELESILSELGELGIIVPSAIVAASSEASIRPPNDDEEVKYLRQYRCGNWRQGGRLQAWFYACEDDLRRFPGRWTEDRLRRLWNLRVWMVQPRPEADRQRLPPETAVAGFKFGALNRDDIFDLLLGPRPAGEYYQNNFYYLASLSGRKPTPIMESTPGLAEIVDQCRRRVLEVEIRRGDTPTVVTNAARTLIRTGGMEVLLNFLAALGKEPLARGYSYYGGDNRVHVFSKIIRSTFPDPEDTPERFADALRASGIPEEKWIDLALFAPHWAKHIEQAIGWPEFAESVWWFHAHTKDNQWSVEAEIRESWAAEISDKTPLTADDLTQGAVDVAWFRRVYAGLGADRWGRLDAAARYASSGLGHKRAQLFADAMLGRTAKEDLVKRITEKRHQDSVRALGLLPLPEDPELRQDETLLRYAAIREFLRTSKQFGPIRQENEKIAARIGMENLARTVGYPDPIRLEWAMETRAVADLKAGPVTVEADDVTVTLSVNPLGRPDLVTVKKGRVLAAIPPKAKKNEAVAALVARKKEIERQASRMKESLETAMIRGDRFSGRELRALFDHPVLTPMLRSLVFVEEAGGEPILGYPQDEGGVLEDCEGTRFALGNDLMLRLAHPWDLLHTGKWDRWQRDCFLRERVQPFKQVFRELYVLTDQERADATFSARYSGHQVNPKQALALLNKRGWVNSYEDGARKTYHDAKITAWLGSVGLTLSPLDVEGFTIENLRFTRPDRHGWLPLAEVPPRLFSETMRDLDLVVSVAHMGGVDPEASASTVEMRAALVREASTLLKLDNVRVEKSHVLIAGTLGSYSIHLGSAIVHRQPGGFVCIVPSHAQHRGRLFLPFADDDPRSAEVVSKTLLLARDSEIKDPTILEQLVAVR